MGLYIYVLKSPKHTVKIKVNGKEEVAGLLKFSHKPLGSGFWGGKLQLPKWEILANARIARIEKLWNGNTPKYAVLIGEKVEPGNSVLDWYSAGYPSSVCCDDYNFGGRKFIGTLDANLNVILK